MRLACPMPPSARTRPRGSKRKPFPRPDLSSNFGDALRQNSGATPGMRRDTSPVTTERGSGLVETRNPDNHRCQGEFSGYVPSGGKGYRPFPPLGTYPLRQCRPGGRGLLQPMRRGRPRHLYRPSRTNAENAPITLTNGDGNAERTRQSAPPSLSNCRYFPSAPITVRNTASDPWLSLWPYSSSTPSMSMTSEE